MPVPPRRHRDKRADRVLVRVDQEALRAKHTAPAGEVVEPDRTPNPVPPSPTTDIVWSFDQGIAKWKGFRLDTGAEFDGGATRYVTTGMGSLVGDAVTYDHAGSLVCFFNGTTIEVPAGSGTGSPVPPGESAGDPDPTFYDATMWHYWPMNGSATEVTDFPGSLGRETNPATGTLTATGTPVQAVGIDGYMASVLANGEKYSHSESASMDVYSVGARFKFRGGAWVEGNSIALASGPGTKNTFVAGLNVGGQWDFTWGDITHEFDGSQEWHNVVGVYNGSLNYQKLYFDGTLAGSLGTDPIGVEPGSNWKTNSTWEFAVNTKVSGEEIVVDDITVWVDSIGPTAADTYNSITLGNSVQDICAVQSTGWKLIPVGETSGTGGVGLTMSEPPAPSHQYKHNSALTIGDDRFGVFDLTADPAASTTTGLDGNALDIIPPVPTGLTNGVLMWDATSYPSVQPVIPAGSSFSVTGWVYLDFADGIYGSKRIQPFSLSPSTPPFENFYIEPTRVAATGDEILWRAYWRGASPHFHREDITFSSARGRWMFYAYAHTDGGNGRVFIGIPGVGTEFRDVPGAATSLTRNDTAFRVGGSTGIFYEASDTCLVDETHVWVGHALSEQEMYYMYGDEHGRTYQT